MERESVRERTRDRAREGFEGQSRGMPWEDARLDDFGQGSRDRGAGHSDSSLAESRATNR